MPKEELEFKSVDEIAFTACAGDAKGLSEQILSDAGGGAVTRLLNFDAGTDTSPNGVQSHDFWEEVYVLEGSLTDLRLGETFTAGMYACRPAGMAHGPWRSDDGCVTFEVRYHD